MIKLTKGAKPAILAKNEKIWTDELEREIASGGDKVAYRSSKYNAKEIKDAIIMEVRGKCAYCEAHLLHVTYGDIEHIVPKSTNVRLTFEWNNLTLACDRCNTNKGEQLGLYDPYVDDPEGDFVFLGPMISHKDGSHSAELTHIGLKLNRAQLLERRCERIQSLVTSLERLRRIADDRTRALLERAVIIHETSPDREFSACIKAVVRSRGLDAV